VLQLAVLAAAHIIIQQIQEKPERLVRVLLVEMVTIAEVKGLGQAEVEGKVLLVLLGLLMVVETEGMVIPPLSLDRQ
jgi:hypothetical protein